MSNTVIELNTAAADLVAWLECCGIESHFVEVVRAKLAEQPAPVQGWKMVPLQPTDQMRDAGNVIIGDRGALFAAYHAMLAAAPQAPKEKS